MDTENGDLMPIESKAVNFRDLPVYDHNPFIEPIVNIKTKRKTVQITSKPNMAITQDGEYFGDSFMVVKKQVDKEEFIKVFKDQLSIIFELSKTGQKVLTYFIKNLGVNKDYVIFDKDKAKEYSGLSSTASIYAGLTELVKKNIIARSHLPLMYYINPQIIFNGDRLAVLNIWMKENKMGPTNALNSEDWPENSLPESPK